MKHPLDDERDDRGWPLVITDQQLLEPGTREFAIRELAAAAAAAKTNGVSVRVAIVRSPAGEWRVVHEELELGDAEVSLGLQVFRGESAESGSLLGRIAWATREVLKLLADRASPASNNYR